MNRNTARRNRLAALGLSIAGQAVAVAAGGILGQAVRHLTVGHGLWTSAAAAVTAFIVFVTVSLFAGNRLRPVIARLRDTGAAETGQ